MKLIKTTELGLMKFTNLDATAGNTLANMLEIRHIDLMKVINKAMKYDKSHCVNSHSETHMLNAVFKDWEYQNSRGRTYKTYIMNEDALYLVISYLEYTPKAHEAKVWFKSEFNKLRLERSHRADSKILTTPLADALQELYKALYDAGSSQLEAFLYTNFHKKSYKSATGKKFRKDCLDALTYDEGCRLAEIRDNATKQLIAMLESDIEPKAIRANLWKYLDGFSQ